MYDAFCLHLKEHMEGAYICVHCSPSNNVKNGNLDTCFFPKLIALGTFHIYVHCIPDVTSLRNIKSLALKTITIIAPYLLRISMYVIGACFVHANMEPL